ncbi:MAG: decarboxylase [Deltaproteobacteria bacterium]|nr:decarboxylase [Deltaproteobacteria bacterium]
MVEDPITIQDLKSVFAQECPTLPEAELKLFVHHYFQFRDTYLDILGIHPPPIYVLEPSVLEQRAHRFRNAFRAHLPESAFYFAVKSNNHPEVSNILLGCGFGLEVSSGLELDTALKLDARDIVFNGPGKTEAELRLAARNPESVVVLMDSFGELQRLEAIAAKENAQVRAGVRLTTIPEGLWRKFGIVPDDLPSFWETAARCTHVRLVGLHFHSSWNLTPDSQIGFTEVLAGVLTRMPGSFRQQLEFIDIGGGYWPGQGEWLQTAGTPKGMLRKALMRQTESGPVHYRMPALSIERFAEPLAAAIREQILPIVDCRIFLEPGRWICNDAMHLLISVVDKKAEDLVITDAGANAVGWERFETDYFPILNLTRPAMTERPCHILGSLCTPHDVWGYGYWGEDIRPGDVLMIPTQGAYTYSLRQHFIKPVPPVITVGNVASTPGH